MPSRLPEVFPGTLAKSSPKRAGPPYVDDKIKLPVRQCLGKFTEHRGEDASRSQRFDNSARATRNSLLLANIDIIILVKVQQSADAEASTSPVSKRARRGQVRLEFWAGRR